MQFPNNLSNIDEMLSKVPQQKVAQVLTLAVLCYMAFLLAKITWLTVDDATNFLTVPAVQSSNFQDKNQQTVDLTALKKMNLFGVHSPDKPKVAPVQVQDAPETKLNLTLTGVVATNETSTAAAIIEKSGKQETYGIDDKITGTRATLETVYSDRVIINVSGSLETLMLDGIKYRKGQERNERRVTNERSREDNQNRFDAPQIVDRRDDAPLSQSVQQLKEDIQDDPGNIIDYLRISPKRKNGDIIGYSLMPGNKAEFFTASGLKAGDVAVQINGYDLTIPSNAAQALQELKEQQEISLVVDRDGDLTEILFSITN
ncbi:type II secretion system protein GspC [Thalassotalea ganghwensis]